MLSDEEKQAIEIVKGITENDLLNYWEGPEEPYDAIQIVLNLITKQSKEIEELKKKNKPQSDCAEPVERTEEMVNIRWVNYNYISKDKIKEKIEEYKKERSNMTQIIFSKYGKTQQTFKQAVYNEVIKVLDELLGE